jgi:hypothetical protein
MECAKVNVNWRDVLNDMAELYEVAAEKNIPDEIVANVLGLEPAASVSETPEDEEAVAASDDDVPADDEQETDEDTTTEKESADNGT